MAYHAQLGPVRSVPSFSPVCSSAESGGSGSSLPTCPSSTSTDSSCWTDLEVPAESDSAGAPVKGRRGRPASLSPPAYTIRSTKHGDVSGEVEWVRKWGCLTMRHEQSPTRLGLCASHINEKLDRNRANEFVECDVC